jgi:hypothetical protein
MLEIKGWELQELINIRPEGVALEGSEAILKIKSPWAGRTGTVYMQET